MALAAKVPHVQPRRLTILGSTGSVGCNTIDLIDRSPSRYEIVALTANRNAIALAEQARRLRPSLDQVDRVDGHIAASASVAMANWASGSSVLAWR